jgi:hypothetical protein
VEGAIEKSSELSDCEFELEAVDDEFERLALVPACPGFVARASSPATSMPAAATTTRPRLTIDARCFAAWIRDMVGYSPGPSKLGGPLRSRRGNPPRK